MMLKNTRDIFKSAMACVLILQSFASFAYNRDEVINVKSVQAGLDTTGVNAILLPQPLGGCVNDWVVPQSGTTGEARKAMMQVALLAFTTNKKVRLFYDTNDNCALHYIRIVHD